jgi:HEAT repeat protein
VTAELLETVKGWLGLADFDKLTEEFRRGDPKTRLRIVSAFAALGDKDPRALAALFDALWDPSRDVQLRAMEELFTALSPQIYEDFVRLEQVDPDNRLDHIHHRYMEIIKGRVLAGQEPTTEQAAKIREALLWKYPPSTAS